MSSKCSQPPRPSSSFLRTYPACRSEDSAKAESVYISLVGIIPISTVDLYGRLGWAHSKLSGNANATLPVNVNERQDEATYALGARWTFVPNWGVFGEWVKNDRIRVDAFMGRIDFRF